MKVRDLSWIKPNGEICSIIGPILGKNESEPTILHHLQFVVKSQKLDNPPKFVLLFFSDKFLCIFLIVFHPWVDGGKIFIPKRNLDQHPSVLDASFLCRWIRSNLDTKWINSHYQKSTLWHIRENFLLG